MEFRKIKTFVFDNYTSHDDCVSAANDYYAIVTHKVDSGAKVIMTDKYIAVLLPEISGLFNKQTTKSETLTS